MWPARLVGDGSLFSADGRGRATFIPWSALLSNLLLNIEPSQYNAVIGRGLRGGERGTEDTSGRMPLRVAFEITAGCGRNFWVITRSSLFRRRGVLILARVSFSRPSLPVVARGRSRPAKSSLQFFAGAAPLSDAELPGEHRARIRRCPRLREENPSAPARLVGYDYAPRGQSAGQVLRDI